MEFQEEEFTRLYTTYSQPVFRLAMVYLGKREDAEEILQETFVRFLLHAPQFANNQKERGWLLTTTVNLCKDRLKSSWRRKVVLMEDGAGAGVGEEQSNEAGRALADEQDERLWQAVWDLPDKYKGPVHLYYYEGYRADEIGELLGLSHAAVKMRLSRARKRLRLELNGDIKW